MSRKDLRIGDVINEMQFGEYAIPTRVGDRTEETPVGYTPNRSPIHWRESDGVLVNIRSSQPLFVGKTRGETTTNLYAILSVEEYQTYRDTGVLPE